MKALLQYLFNGNSLSQKEAETALKDIASGNQTEAQVAAFLSVYNMRFPTTHEMIGFRKAMLELAIPIKFKEKRILDIVGTGGDGKDTFNISTLAAFVCAGAGVKVAKHGNYAVSSVSGSSNVLEFLDVQFGNTQEVLNQQLNAANITFLHAPLFHPAMRNVANVRKQLQLKTIFNLLGPIVNPCYPNVQLIGVHSDLVGKLYKDVLKTTESDFAIVHALDGYDEISLTDDVRVFTRKSTHLYNPKILGFAKINATDIYGGKNLKENAKTFLSILKGNGTAAQNNVVLANAAFAISLYAQNSYLAALEDAKKSLFNGYAFNSFEKLKSIQ